MTVNFDSVPIKRGKLFRNRIRRVDFFHRAVNLQVIVVDKRNQIVKTAVACKHRRFPDLSFLNLAVAEDGIYTVIRPVELCAERHPDCRGNALPQRACTHINTGDFIHIRMPLQIAVRLAERLDIRLREKALECKRRIHCGRGMPFGKHQTVTVLHFRVLRIHAQFVVVKHA